MRQFADPRSRRGSESWTTIYMDMMTMVMVFFVILWSIGQKQHKGISNTIGDQTVKMVNLPGDVLFASGQSTMTPQGKAIFKKLFGDDAQTVLNFDTGNLVKRLLVIHGHTDNVGTKDHNFELGYRRAWAAYKEILKYGDVVADHAVICTHADNSPARDVPDFHGALTPDEQAAVRAAQAKNRRITIEDQVVNRFTGD